MENIWELYENINEVAYVSDMDTYDIVYINRKVCQLYGVKSAADFHGKKCYEIFQNSAHPCIMCNNHLLRPGQYQEWHYHNPIQDKEYLAKDTMLEVDGRRLRLELAIDCSNDAFQKALVRKYIDTESLINEALRLSLSSSDPDRSINILLEYVCKSLHCDRIFVLEKKPSGCFDNTYEWCANDVVSQSHNLQGIPEADPEPWLARFRNNENIIIADVNQARISDPVVEKYLVPQGVQSMITSALNFNGQIIGFFGVDNPPPHLLDNISTLFMILSSFIVSLLRRRDLQNQLEYKSFYDELTQLGNRHLMDTHLAQLDPNKSIGIVYSDVTGLKEVNDSQGHKAGDALLVQAGRCLRSVFGDHALFRMGGDEFLVLCEGISRLELESKVTLLRLIQTQFGVNLATGWVWDARCGMNINALLAKADEQMYADKRRYYTGQNDRRSSN